MPSTQSALSEVELSLVIPKYFRILLRAEDLVSRGFGVVVYGVYLELVQSWDMAEASVGVKRL